MAGKMHLWPEDRLMSDGFVTVAAILERPDPGGTRRLWYRLPEEYAPALAQNCDPLVVGAIFSIMGHGGGCTVHGSVSPSLLRNLEEFQAAWACWLPELYAQAEITAGAEKELPGGPAHPDGAILGFSGGVDSAFSAWRHHTGRAGRLSRRLHAGVMVHGFDIGLHEPDVFDHALARSRRMLDSIGLPVIPMVTNFRELNTRWTETQGAGLASCLMLLAGGFGAGLIGNTYAYRNLLLPYGSNPITDGLMSSDTFHIIHDGAGFNRSQKIRELAHWPAAMRHLRVCWEGQQHDLNCGTCRKCVRTILDFRAAGLPLPPCFERDINHFQIATVTGGAEIEFVLDTLDAIKANSVSGSWVWAFYIRWWLSQLRHWGKLILRAGD